MFTILVICFICITTSLRTVKTSVKDIDTALDNITIRTIYVINGTERDTSSIASNEESAEAQDGDVEYDNLAANATTEEETNRSNLTQTILKGEDYDKAEASFFSANTTTKETSNFTSTSSEESTPESAVPSIKTDVKKKVNNLNFLKLVGNNSEEETSVYNESNDNSKNESDYYSNWYAEYSIEEYSEDEFISKNASDFVLDVNYVKGSIPLLNRKVHRGQRVSVYEFPFVVSIRRNLAHYLTGVVITPNVALTAAHGVYKVPIYDLTLVLGENYSDRGTYLVPIVFSIFHENFDPYTLEADLALLRTKFQMIFRGNLKEILVLRQGIPITETDATVAGWGRCDLTGKEVCMPRSTVFYPNEIQDPMLRSVKFYIDDEDFCEVYTNKMGITLKPGMVCVGPSRLHDVTAPCMAVPGAPLVVFSYLVGLQSWGYGCGYRQDLPIVYTDIGFYLGWLEHNLKVLLNVSNEQADSLYIASQSYVLARTIREISGLPPLTNDGSNILEMLPLDETVSHIQGTIYDYRDFIFDGVYSRQKQTKYKHWRKERQKQLLISMNDPKHFTECPEPFLNPVDFDVNATIDEREDGGEK